MVGDAEAVPTPESGAHAPRIVTPLLHIVDVLGEIALLTRDVIRACVRRPPTWKTIVDQLEQIGWRSLSIVTLTALSMGMVLALQLGNFLERFGAKMFVSRIVGVSLVREMAPILTALMLAGRVGAGITAELGTMAVSEQIDAVRALGASPVRVLIVPRMLAVMVMLPILTMIADFVGVLGGLFISTTELRVSSDFYWNSLLYGMVLNDLFSGLGKSVFFAYFIGIIACYNGLHTTGGADGVGRATTATVVAASITILVADFFLTKLFLNT
jgi:phospholipid/cholesterol/gamma-HCH transport system permease protein